MELEVSCEVQHGKNEKKVSVGGKFKIQPRVVLALIALVGQLLLTAR